MGDPQGIGPEVTRKALAFERGSSLLKAILLLSGIRNS